MSRRLQFSLRALLVATLAISLLLGFKTEAKHRQTMAIAKLRAKGAEITVEPAGTPSARLVDKLKPRSAWTCSALKLCSRRRTIAMSIAAPSLTTTFRLSAISTRQRMLTSISDDLRG